jgi:hypothetical protein
MERYTGPADCNPAGAHCAAFVEYLEPLRIIRRAELANASRGELVHAGHRLVRGKESILLNFCPFCGGRIERIDAALAELRAPREATPVTTERMVNFAMDRKEHPIGTDQARNG